MPRRPRKNAEHRIPVNDDRLFEELRDYALEHDLTWADALRKLLTAAQTRHETIEENSAMKELVS